MYLFIVYHHINNEKWMWEHVSSISASRAKCSKMVLNEVRNISQVLFFS